MKPHRPATRVLTEAFWLAIGIPTIPLMAYADIHLLGNGLSEMSLTEQAQAGALLLIVVLMFRLALVTRMRRGFCVLAAGFVSCLFIRESDYLFDHLYHGAWKPFVALATIITLTLAYRYRHGTRRAMNEFANHRASAYMTAGLLTALVFSRTFGTRRLWEEISRSRAGLTKTTVQECLELFGYVLVVLGTVGYVRFVRAKIERSRESADSVIRLPSAKLAAEQRPAA